jgi:hypothetical protein
MYKFKFLIALALLATSALAQSALEVGNPSDQGDPVKRISPATEREQRRAELRQALRATHAQEAPAPKQPVEPVGWSRRLSAKERAELRQQLRAQQRDQGGAGK